MAIRILIIVVMGYILISCEKEADSIQLTPCEKDTAAVMFNGQAKPYQYLAAIATWDFDSLYQLLNITIQHREDFFHGIPYFVESIDFTLIPFSVGNYNLMDSSIYYLYGSYTHSIERDQLGHGYDFIPGTKNELIIIEIDTVHQRIQGEF